MDAVVAEVGVMVVVAAVLFLLLLLATFNDDDLGDVSWQLVASASDSCTAGRHLRLWDC